MFIGLANIEVCFAPLWFVIKNPMPTIEQLKNLSELRVEEAEALYASGLYDGACYIGGYAVELAFKARICFLLKTEDYPAERFKDYKIHRFNDLVFLAGLNTDWESKKQTNIPFRTNSDLVFAWNEGWRYNKKNTKSLDDARCFLDAITHPQNGVLTWIKTKW